MLHENRRRASSFGEDADHYDRARPAYPTELVTDLLDGAALEGEDPRVLDVGCGTGIAARLFAAQGARVLGLEPDPRMAEVARRHGVEVEIGGFEDWDAGERRFELLVSAQAWHWVDPVRGAAKAAEVVEPGGQVALFWNTGRPKAPMLDALRAVYATVAPELGAGSIVLGGLPATFFDAPGRPFIDTGAFERLESVSYDWEQRYSTGEWVDLVTTHSDHSTLEPQQLQALVAATTEVLDAAGGVMTMEYETRLIRARRR